MRSPPIAPPLELRRAASADDGAFAVLELRAPAGAALPPHVCARHDGTLLVLEGELEVVLADERRVIGAGGQLRLLRARPRRFAVLADARLLLVTVPAGLETVAEALAEPAPDADDLAALLTAAGIKLLPAGWSAGVR